MDQSKTIIRIAEAGDINSVASMWLKLSLDQLSKDPYFTGEIPCDIQGAIGNYLEVIKNKDCGIYVLENESKLYGFIEVWKHERDFHFFEDDYAYVLHYYIEESYRNSQESIYYFHQLYNAAEEWGRKRNLKYIVADVFEHNNKVAKLLDYLCKMKLYRHRLAKKLDTE